MTEPAPTPRTMWRIAGALALAHVVLFLLAVAVSGPPTIHPGQEGIEHSWHEGPVAQVMASGYLNVLGFLALLPAFVFLGSVVGRRTAAGRWAAQTATLAGLGFVLVVVGTGFAAGGAAGGAEGPGSTSRPRSRSTTSRTSPTCSAFRCSVSSRSRPATPP